MNRTLMLAATLLLVLLMVLSARERAVLDPLPGGGVPPPDDKSGPVVKPGRCGPGCPCRTGILNRCPCRVCPCNPKEERR